MTTYTSREIIEAARLRLEADNAALRARVVELERERDMLCEALSDLLRLHPGYSVETYEVGWCTVPEEDRRWVDKARDVLERTRKEHANDR